MSMIGFKFLVKRFVDICHTITNKAKLYIRQVKTSENKYSEILSDKLNEFFNLDDLFLLEEENRCVCLLGNDRRIEFFEQSPFSINNLWLSETKENENLTRKQSGKYPYLKKVSDNLTKSTNTNSRRCSNIALTNYGSNNKNKNSNYESKSSKDLANLERLKSLNEDFFSKMEEKFEKFEELEGLGTPHFDHLDRLDNNFENIVKSEKREFNFTSFRNSFFEKNENKTQKFIRSDKRSLTTKKRMSSAIVNSIIEIDNFTLKMV